MKKGGVIGVKGFDGKFYAVTRSYFNASQSAVNTVLKEDIFTPNIMDKRSISAANLLSPED